MTTAERPDSVDALRGASSETVRTALADGNPLPGTRGFAGALDTEADALCVDAAGRPLAGRGGRLVRDVLGRQPLFVECVDAGSETTPTAWSVDPARLDDPRPVPPGSVLDLNRDAGPSDGDLRPSDGDRNPSGGDLRPSDGDGNPSGGDLRPSDGDWRPVDRATPVWTLPDPPAETDQGTALDTVATAVLESLRDVDGRGASHGSDVDAEPTSGGDVAVAFSGGVDSALVASSLEAGLGREVPWYVVGFPDSHDVAAARAAADAMDHDLRVVELTHDDLREAVPAVARATGRTNPMDVQIALPLFLAARAAAADGADRLAVGQGADELFGGYAKVVSPADDGRVDADTVRGARRETVETLPRQLERDVLALRAAGVEPLAPFLDDRVVRAALPLPDELLATPSERKVALRRAARGRVPDTVVSADKKAVQYGSLVSRELDRLARQAGFKRRMDDHVGQYVRSLVAETANASRAADATADDDDVV